MGSAMIASPDRSPLPAEAREALLDELYRGLLFGSGDGRSDAEPDDFQFPAPDEGGGDQLNAA